MSHSGRSLTDAIVAKIATLGVPVRAGIKPEAGGWQGTPGASTFDPYVVVSATPGGVFDGPIGVPFEDAQPDYVIASFAATHTACQVLADAVLALILAGGWTIAGGRTVQLAYPDVEGGVVRDDDAQPPVFYSPTRWRFYTTA